MQSNSILQASLDSAEGFELLLAMRKIYYGDTDVGNYPADVLESLKTAELVNLNNSEITLTTNGYVFGNICKEYCNWIENDRKMPPPKPDTEYFEDKAVLDLGCSFGRWLWEFDSAKELIGIELETAYVEAAKILSTKESKRDVRIINASIEDLKNHVKPKTIDFVYCRLVFNHVDIKKTLPQVFDTLRTDGKFWLQVENYKFPFSILMHERRLRSKARAIFTVVNSIAYTLLGKQIRLTAEGRMHQVHQSVYPPAWVWKRQLEKAGFKDISVRFLERGYIFIANKH